ncbi:hypothetical protein MRX96_034593 [Rhipicephalus microplus]
MRHVLYCTKMDSSPRGRPPLTKIYRQINDSVFVFLQSPSTCTLNIMRIVGLTERPNYSNVFQIVPMSSTQMPRDTHIDQQWWLSPWPHIVGAARRVV